jgi:hypothetical protein
MAIKCNNISRVTRKYDQRKDIQFTTIDYLKISYRKFAYFQRTSVYYVHYLSMSIVENCLDRCTDAKAVLGIEYQMIRRIVKTTLMTRPDLNIFDCYKQSQISLYQPSRCVPLAVHSFAEMYRQSLDYRQ